MQFIIRAWASLYLLLSASIAISEELSGRFISIERIHISDQITIEAGETVEYLGVLEVSRTISPSGRLATLRYGDSILNLDAELFYKASEGANFDYMPVISKNDGDTASLCTTVILSSTNNNLDFKKTDLKRFIRLKSQGNIVSDFSVLKPLNHDGYRRHHTDFCISGLNYSEKYEVTLLSGLNGYSGQKERALNQNISFIAKTENMKPAIELQAVKNILPKTFKAVIPVTTVNIDEFEVSLHRIDLRTITSYGSLFKSLNRYDHVRLNEYWGEHLGTQKVSLSTEMNKPQSFNINLDSMLSDVETGLFVATFHSEKLGGGRYTNRPTQWFMISDVAVTLYHGLEYTELFLTDFGSNKSVRDAKVEVFSANNKNLFEGSVDNFGHVKIQNTRLSGSGGLAPEFLVVSSEQSGVTIMRLKDLNSKPRMFSTGQKKEHREDVYLTTDRNIYRPGDTINTMGVIRDLNLDPINDQDFQLQLVQNDGTVISDEIVFTDQHGVFDAALTIKPTTFLGRYSLNVSLLDETLLASHEIHVDDFVPLTIEPKIVVENEIWNLDENQKIKLSAEYFSGGGTSHLKGEIKIKVKRLRAFETDGFKGFVFGKNDDIFNQEAENFSFELNENGQAEIETFTRYNLEKNALYAVKLEGAVLDLGGRPNKVRISIPLDTSEEYIGLLPEFGDHLDDNVIAGFSVTNINRSGIVLPLPSLKYKVTKIDYRYNWYEDDGWRWRRVRAGERIVETGIINQKNFSLTSALDWGYYEIAVTNETGFETVHGFYSGWGGDQKPITEPQELSLYVDVEDESSSTLKLEAPFDGKLRVLLAGSDILGVQEFLITKGSVSLPILFEKNLEPGFHLLATLSRPIQKGSEHLPQIAMGSFWIKNVSQIRNPKIEILLPEVLTSDETIKLQATVSAKSGTAIAYLVDDGIHAVTGYENKDIADHFLAERELALGIQTNFGDLIQQDQSLDLYRVGGGDELSSTSSIEKSDFFKTVAIASPLIAFDDGVINFVFPPAKMEGRFRLVLLVSTVDGIAFAQEEVRVQDPVSLDISLPRFVAPGDDISGKIAVRSNEFTGDLTMEQFVGSTKNELSILIENGKKFTASIALSTWDEGRMPVFIEVGYGPRKINHEFGIISRSASYPMTETKSLLLSKRNWLGKSRTNVPALKSSAFNVSDQNSLDIIYNLSPNFGANRSQILASLDRYPYGCIEQTSSATRGLIARATELGMKPDLKKKINNGIDKIIAKQKMSGAFGYWDRHSYVYARYQPYALETLMKALPYAYDRDAVSSAITKGLDYLYTVHTDDLKVKLYSYGLLAKAGYEVTSRARYTLDKELDLLSLRVQLTSSKELSPTGHLDKLSLAYWTAAQLNDDLRMNLISELMAQTLSKTSEIVEPSLDRYAAWLPSAVNRSGRYNYPNTIIEQATAPNFASSLADLDNDHQTNETLEIISRTQAFLASKLYRSTIANANLMTLYQARRNVLDIEGITIDGAPAVISSDGIIQVSDDQIRNGFDLRHNSVTPLVLNAEIVGRRESIQSVDNGLSIRKYWHDAFGKPIDLSNGVLEATQGDLFTVVIEVEATSSTNFEDLLVTDLLPSGFELEETLISPPKVFMDDGSLSEISLDFGKTPSNIQKMDDRYVAHFQGRWRSNETAILAYTIRAAFAGEMTIPDAHAEQMYAPEISGRSNVARAIVEPN